jgi:hypothetical protein
VPETTQTGGAVGPVIICYDGSKYADAALDAAAKLLPGASVLVLTVWKPILQAILAGSRCGGTSSGPRSRRRS